MTTPQHIERAANRAAVKVKQHLIELLMAHQLGSVTIEVTPEGLKPIKRVEHEDKTIKLGRADETLIAITT